MRAASSTGTVRGDDAFDLAFNKLGRHLPDWLAKTVKWLRAPGRRWIRIPVGLVFLAGGLLWFLPVLGLEMLPIGLALLAVDLPFLRRPSGRLLLWIDACWRRLERRWKHASWPGLHRGAPSLPRTKD